jgi:UDP-N-acetylglucosamine 4,6-dehydratase
MSPDLAGKTVLITGATGSIGSELLNQILSSKVNRVVIFSRDELKQFMLKKKISDDRLETVIGDVRDYSALRKTFLKFDFDIVYHAAAMKHVIICENYPTESIKTNVIGTQNLVELASEFQIPKLITISTDKSALPVNVMGACKFLAEKITIDANYSCVRFGNVANSRGSVIPVLIENLIKKKPITITDPRATRFILRISEAVKLVTKAADLAKGGEIFILKMKAFNLGDLLDVMIDKIAPKLDIDVDNIKIYNSGLVSGERLHEHLINDTELNRIYESDGVYVVLKDHSNLSQYSNLKKINLNSYLSNQSELMTKEDLEILLLECLEEA